MAHYLVTGGCGFIGSHLVERLLADGHKITVLDDLSTGKRENIPAQVTFVKGCITDAKLVEKCLNDADGCFHLAAIASVQKSVENWAETHRVNLTGTINIFNAARARKLPVLYVSSAAIYGNNLNLPLSETEMPCPLTAYGADKLGCEQHAFVATQVYKVPTIGFRLFNIYGPRQDPSSPYSGVISIFMDRLSKHSPITIFGDGSQKRDFVYVSDVATIFAASMQKLCKGEVSGGVYNIARGESISIKELATIIAECAGGKPQITYAAAREGDIKDSCGNNQKLKNTIGIVPVVNLKEGLQKTYADFEKAAGNTPQKCVVGK